MDRQKKNKKKEYSKKKDMNRGIGKKQDTGEVEMEQDDYPGGETDKRQGKGTPGYFGDTHFSPGSESHYHMDARQAQMQHQIQRNIEASKQMLFGVFGNVVTMLEEYERRELAAIGNTNQAMPSSAIKIPEQGHKTFEDIKSNVETQLLLFETQTRACPPEALAEVHEELKRHTIGWSAVRAEKGIEGLQQTDYYISKLYEILAKGRTDHKPVERHDVTAEAMKEGFQAILYGEHDRQVLDKEFKDDPDKTATFPKIRSSEMLPAGAERISRAMGDSELDRHLNNDIQQFEKDGPRDIK